MGGGNWLHDDSAVNGECHLIKWIHTALFIMLGLRRWPVGGGGWWACTQIQAIWVDWSLETRLLAAALRPEPHLAPSSCVCVRNAASVLLQWLSSWQRSALSKSDSMKLRCHLSNIHLLFPDTALLLTLPLTGLPLARLWLELLCQEWGYYRLSWLEIRSTWPKKKKTPTG